MIDLKGKSEGATHCRVHRSHFSHGGCKSESSDEGDDASNRHISTRSLLWDIAYAIDCSLVVEEARRSTVVQRRGHDCRKGFPCGHQAHQQCAQRPDIETLLQVLHLSGLDDGLDTLQRYLITFRGVRALSGWVFRRHCCKIQVLVFCLQSNQLLRQAAFSYIVSGHLGLWYLDL